MSVKIKLPRPADRWFSDGSSTDHGPSSIQEVFERSAMKRSLCRLVALCVSGLLAACGGGQWQ